MPKTLGSKGHKAKGSKSLRQDIKSALEPNELTNKTTPTCLQVLVCYLGFWSLEFVCHLRFVI
jgi:hypothetical protein